MYSLNMLPIAMELARDETYEDVASKFWEHFVNIAHAMNTLAGRSGTSEDGFYHDVLHLPDGERIPLRMRSMVGLIPLYAVETLDPAQLAKVPAFARRLEWFIDHRPDLTAGVACMRTPGRGERRLFSIVSPDRLRRDPAADAGRGRVPHRPTASAASAAITSSSRTCWTWTGCAYGVRYEPAECSTGLFGGNRTGAGRSGSRSTTS